jgi:hypothetical protein
MKTQISLEEIQTELTAISDELHEASCELVRRQINGLPRKSDDETKTFEANLRLCRLRGAIKYHQKEGQA